MCMTNHYFLKSLNPKILLIAKVQWCTHFNFFLSFSIGLSMKRIEKYDRKQVVVKPKNATITEAKENSFTGLPNKTMETINPNGQ